MLSFKFWRNDTLSKNSNHESNRGITMIDDILRCCVTLLTLWWERCLSHTPSQWIQPLGNLWFCHQVLFNRWRIGNRSERCWLCPMYTWFRYLIRTILRDLTMTVSSHTSISYTLHIRVYQQVWLNIDEAEDSNTLLEIILRIVWTIIYAFINGYINVKPLLVTHWEYGQTHSSHQRNNIIWTCILLLTNKWVASLSLVTL